MNHRSIYYVGLQPIFKYITYTFLEYFFQYSSVKYEREDESNFNIDVYCLRIMISETDTKK